MIRTLSFALFVTLAPSIGHAVIADCTNYFGRVNGTIEMNTNLVIELRALTEILTEKAPKATSPHIQKLRDTLAGALHRMAPDNTMESLASDFMRNVRYMTPEEMNAVEPSFKTFLEMVKAWDTKYPPKLVQEKLWPALKSLEDLEFNGSERKAFNKDIETAFATALAKQVLEAEQAGGDPDRPGFQYRVDQGYRPRAATGTTGSGWRNGPREQAPTSPQRPPAK